MPIYTNSNTSIVGYDLMWNPDFLNDLGEGQENIESILKPNFSLFDGDAELSTNILDTLFRGTPPKVDFSVKGISLRDTLYQAEHDLQRAVENAIRTIAINAVVEFIPIAGDILGIYNSAKRAADNPTFFNVINLARNLIGIIPGLGEAEQALETVERFGRLARSLITAGDNIQDLFDEPSFKNAAILFDRFRISANKFDIFLRSAAETLENINEGTEQYIGSEVDGLAEGITIAFSSGASYRYLSSVIGEGRLEHMITLAETGSGLNSYINKEVRQLYS